VEFELQRAREEVKRLLPEIQRSLHLIAEEEVEVESLRESLAQKEARLASQEEAILSLSADLKSGDTKFVYMGRKFNVSQVQKDLTERFNRFTTLEETVKREQEMLVAKEAALESSRQTLSEMLSQRKDLEVELERLEARIRTVEARRAISAISIDDSQLARVKQLIKEIDKRLDVEDKVLDAEGNFGGLIPVETQEEEVQAEDILERIESRFGAPAAAEPSMTTAQAHN
jgi:chromosome segregation ATPase